MVNDRPQPEAATFREMAFDLCFTITGELDVPAAAGTPLYKRPVA